MPDGLPLPTRPLATIKFRLIAYMADAQTAERHPRARQVQVAVCSAENPVPAIAPTMTTGSAVLLFLWFFFLQAALAEALARSRVLSDSQLKTEQILAHHHQ